MRESQNEEDWNKDLYEDLGQGNFSELVVYSRDWTVETIYNQITMGNIDLNPKFQRRNAWKDARRSLLLESLILGIPVPEIVLAEHPLKKKSFIVIDGKQRLLTISGYINPKQYGYWDEPALADLKSKSYLNGVNYEKLSTDLALKDEYRQFINADIRCTVISNFKDEELLYDIFYRLNTSSVPLSSQELRQVFHKGPFAEYLIDASDASSEIHSVLKISGPDPRLRDAELILRYLAFSLYYQAYSGNVKQFLDRAMREINQDWDKHSAVVASEMQRLKNCLLRMFKIMKPKNVGRKRTSDKWESRFNKVLFEVEIFAFKQFSDEEVDQIDQALFFKEFDILLANNAFRATIESTTKSLENYKNRFDLFAEFIKKATGKTIKPSPA